VLLGKLTDSVGWPIPLAIGLLAHVIALCGLIAWRTFGLIVIEHDTYGIVAMFAVAGLWGIGDAAFNRYACMNYFEFRLYSIENANSFDERVFFRFLV
jgi:hypothetical protein